MSSKLSMSLVFKEFSAMGTVSSSSYWAILGAMDLLAMMASMAEV